MRLLQGVGLRREDVFLINVVPIRPPDNKLHRLSEIGYTIEEFTPRLREELRGTEGVVVPLGDTALNVLCGRDGILKWRGSILESTLLPHRLCVPTVHPRYVQEVWPANASVILDLKKALRVARGEWSYPSYRTLTRPTLSEVDTFIQSLYHTPNRMFTYDIETPRSPIKPILCLGLGGEWPDGVRSLCIPFKNGYNNYWEREEEWYVWKRLQDLFHSSLLKVGQYTTFDLTILLPYLGEPSPPWGDTYVMHHLLDPESPHTLAFMTSIYTDQPFYKDDGKEEGIGGVETATSSEQLWEYNGKDVEILFPIYHYLTEELRKENLLPLLYGYQMPLWRASWRLSQRGMLLDEGMRERILKKRMRGISALNKEIGRRVGHPINVNSSKQMMKFLYEDLKLPIQYHKKTRKPTADEEAISKLYAKYPRKEFKYALQARGLVKEIGTYLCAKAEEGGRVTGVFNPCGTETGRSSCKKNFFRRGLDFQNVPPSLRKIFWAGKGRIFKMYDLWQAESIGVAMFSNSLAFKEQLFVKREKIHALVASWIYNKPPSLISKVAKKGEALSEYDVAKRVVHGSSYNMGVNKFAQLIKKPVSEAKLLMNTFHAFAPEIRAWHQFMREEITRTHKIINPFGRQRYFRGRLYPSDAAEETFREGFASLPQGTIADYNHQAQVKLEYLLPKGAIIVQEGFDSLVIECGIEQEGEVDEAVKVGYDKEVEWKGERFRIPYEGKRGERWEK